MERIAVYAGSFDPVTTGHLDIIRRGAMLFDRVVVVIAHHPDKTGCFPVEKRLQLLRRCTEGIGNVTVAAYAGLTTAYARSIGACAMIRGLRSAADYQSEDNLAMINRAIEPEIETVFLISAPQHRMVSSSAVREMAHYGASLQGFVPDEIMDDVLACIKK